MLATFDIVAFVATTDPAAARAFYEGKLGLKLLSDDPFALAFDAHGTMLRVTKVSEVTIAPYTTLGWAVPDIRTAVSDLVARGVEFQRYEGMTQDAVGIWEAPGGGSLAWFKDPAGHTLSLTQH